MIKTITHLLDKIGTKAVIGGILVLTAFILISDIGSFKSLFELRTYDTKVIISIIFLLIGFILIYVELTNPNKHKESNSDTKELLEKDKEMLQNIASLFERRAYFDHDIYQEDLRAIFSAANETRIEIQKLKNKINAPVLRHLLENMYQDFEAIRKKTPTFKSSEIETFDPDATNIKANIARAKQDANYLNGLWRETEDYVKYIKKNKSIGDSKHLPYWAIMKDVKSKLKSLSVIKEHIMRLI